MHAQQNSTPVSFHNFIRQFAQDIVEANGFDLDVGENGVHVEQNCTSPVVDYVESVHEELVVDTLNRLLQGHNVPFSCDSFLNGTLLSTSRSQIAVVDYF